MPRSAGDSDGARVGESRGCETGGRPRTHPGATVGSDRLRDVGDSRTSPDGDAHGGNGSHGAHRPDEAIELRRVVLRTDVLPRIGGDTPRCVPLTNARINPVKEPPAGTRVE